LPVLKLLPSFNSGELSPRMDARTDIEKYDSGLRTLENFVIMPYGGVNRRPGLGHMGAQGNHDKKGRVIEFNFSTTTNFILELGDLTLRFWSNSQQVLVGGNPYEITTVWPEAALYQVQFAQINDIVYMTHPDYPVQKLTRVADDSWTIAAVAYDYPMVLDGNSAQAFTLTPSAKTGTGITVTATGGTPFVAAHVGSQWEIAHRRDVSYEEVDIDADKDGTGIKCIGVWELFTYGTWTAEVLVQRSRDDGTTWETIRTYRSDDDRNVAVSGTELTEVQLRIKIANWSSHTNGKARLEISDNKVYGVVTVTAFTSSTVVTADVDIDMFATTATPDWAEGAWSEVQGYPRTVVLHEQRLVLGGTAKQANRIWGSVTDDFENFRKGTRADQAWDYQIASKENNAINWLVSRNSMLVGTSGDEWTFGSTNDNESISPTNIRVRKQTAYGSKHIQAVLVNEAVLFLQRKGRKIREFVYSFERDTYVAPDLSLLSEHITQNTIVQQAFQQQPDAILWNVTSQGDLIGMTYEREQDVVGWHRHTTDGDFESVAVIYGADGDEIWVTVKRTINGVTKRYVERFDPNATDKQRDDDKDNLFYVDSGVTTTAANKVVSNLDHLEGKTVAILTDGSNHAQKVVTGGKITLDIDATVVIVGIPYESILKPMRLNIDTENGSGQGRIQKVHQVVARLYKSLGGEFGPDINGDFQPIFYRKTGDVMDGSPALFTGDQEQEYSANYSEGGDIIFKQTQPYPLTILALVIKADVSQG